MRYLLSMKRRLAIALLLALLLVCPPANGAIVFPSAPPENQTRPFRLSYLEGGRYGPYLTVLRSLLSGLDALGWISLPKNFDSLNFASSEELWSWAGKNLDQSRLVFVKDALWSFHWKEENRKPTTAQILKRLQEQNDLDGLLALGSWAGQDLATDAHRVPVFVLQSSDPVSAGIVASAQDSGRDHVFAHCDPTRYKRQIALFHNVAPFSRLGVAFEDTPAGRVYAGIQDVRASCKELGVTLVECHTRTNVPDRSEAERSYLLCHEKLAAEVDAMYITHSIAMNAESAEKLLAPFVERKIPTFAQSGAETVRLGALMSMAQADFKSIGLFYANSLGQVLNGAKPRQLNQIFEDPPRMAFNLATAKAISYNAPFEALISADVLFGEKQPPNRAP